MPALLSSLTDASRDDLSAVLGLDGSSRPCLREWLGRVPDPRRPRGRWHPLEFVLALAVCAFTAAGHDSPSAIADRHPQPRHRRLPEGRLRQHRAARRYHARDDQRILQLYGYA